MKWFKQLIDFLRFVLSDKEEKATEPNYLQSIIEEASNEEPKPPSNFPEEVKRQLVKPEQKIIPIIDAGHGGINPRTHEYTTAPAKMHDHGFMIFYEGVFNRNVATHFKRLLRKHGYEFTTIYHDWEDWKLSKRAAIANEAVKAEQKKGRHCLLFSIHGNAFSNPSANGFEVFSHIKGSKLSIEAAEKIERESRKLLPELKPRGAKKANFAILRETTCPATLSEFGFFTNPDEARLMMQEGFQARCAQVLYNTFLHFNSK